MRERSRPEGHAPAAPGPMNSQPGAASLRAEAPTNIVLIGMPGVGKSTLGLLLAKETSRDFVDTDVVLQARAGRRLQKILDAEGPAAFRRIEEDAVCSLRCERTVIATGGSVVYGELAMRHLARDAVVVHLDLPLPALLERLADLPTRGVVRIPGQSIADVHAERSPLYARWADVRVDCAGLGHEQAVARIVAAIAAWQPVQRHAD